MRVLLFIVLVVGSELPASGQRLAGTDTTTLPACFKKASNLLDEAFVLMQKNYYRKNAVAWEGLINAAKKKLISSGDCNETYDIISWCFKALNETHSFIMPPAKAAVYNYDTAGLQQKPLITELVGDIKGELLADGIAYITVPWVSTTDSAICILIADSLQQLISTLDAHDPRGWIIDLRKIQAAIAGPCWPE